MKRIIYATVLLFTLASTINSISAIYQLFHKRDLLLAAQNALKKEQRQNSELKNQLQIVSSQEFIEEEARDKLYLSKSGESTVFIAKDLIGTKAAEIQKPQDKMNWQLWLQVFFN